MASKKIKTYEELKELFQMIHDGISTTDVAKRFKCSESLIYKAIHGSDFKKWYTKIPPHLKPKSKEKTTGRRCIRCKSPVPKNLHRFCRPCYINNRSVDESSPDFYDSVNSGTGKRRSSGLTSVSHKDMK